MRTRLLVIARFFVAAFAFALMALVPTLARAAGTVTVADLQPKEEDGKWKLKMTMNYGTVPPTAHIPMNFEFTQTVLYERTLTDQSPKTPVLTKKPLQNQTPINESMDVSFSDASGKLFNITKFDFAIKRDHGFEAGEYTLVITRTSDGTKMGQPIRLVLQGDNEVVDRRAMVFTGEKKEPKKADAADDKKNEPAKPEDTTPEGDAAAGDTGSAPVESPPPVEKKQGGCGCRVAEPTSGTEAGIVLVAGLALLAHRRRRRSDRAPVCGIR
ncbi:MAG: MYXO-CTERM sorting domain-containing protein [Polyangiaceae bacterium]